METVSFFNEDIEFTLPSTKHYEDWITRLISSYDKVAGDLTYIFCSDNYLLSLNKEHLNHDTFTDIITFDYTNTGIVSGDIFISIDRVRDNAESFQVSFDQELLRVMAHGILHMIGFKDKSDKDKFSMREAEEKAIALFAKS